MNTPNTAKLLYRLLKPTALCKFIKLYRNQTHIERGKKCKEMNDAMVGRWCSLQSVIFISQL